jgi:hypothetical protein
VGRRTMLPIEEVGAGDSGWGWRQSLGEPYHRLRLFDVAVWAGPGPHH